jgi:WD40 repeat protein/DNA-directed RNA polymerase subunit RPC12/RpoP
MDASALECPVCLEIFKDPRTLKCNHTVCLKCAKQLAQLNPKQITCPVCRHHTKVKTTVEKDLSSNFALIPIIDAHLRAVAATASSSSQNPSSGPSAAPVATQIPVQPTNIATQVPPGQPIVSLSQLNERLAKLSETQSHLTAALAHLPMTVAMQQSQIVTQFSLLRQAVDHNEAVTLQNLMTLQATVSAQLQEQLMSCAQHFAEVERMVEQYPSAILSTDVSQWLQAEDLWRAKVSVMQQHGILGAFSANVPSSIPESSISYEGNTVDFPALWATSRDPNFLKTNRSSKPVKAIHFLTQSASGVLRRWNYRERVTISEINHPGVRSWALFEKSSKIIAASAKIKVYDSYTGECLATFDSLSSPAKRIIASGAELKARALSFHVNQGTAALWDLSQNLRLNWDMDTSHWNTNLVMPVALDSPILLVPSMAFPFDVLFFNMITGDYEEGKRLEGNQTDVIDLLPFGDGKYCATLCAGGILSVWDLTTLKAMKTTNVDAKHSKISIQQLKKKEIGKKLPSIAIFSNLSGSFTIYNPMTDRSFIITHNNSQLLSSSIRSVLIYQDGTRALSSHTNARVHVWDLQSGHCIETLSMGITGQFIECNSGHNIVVGTPNGYLNILDAITLSAVPVLPSVIDGSGILVQRIGTLFRT